MTSVMNPKRIVTLMPKATSHQDHSEASLRWANPPLISRHLARCIAGLTSLDIIDSLALHLAITPDKLQQQITQGLYNDRSFE
jgi:hypothetical protein